YASPRTTSDVFACVSRCSHGSAACLGGHVPAAAVRASVLLQLLDGITGAGDRSFLDSGQLPRTAAGECLPANSVSLDVDRGAGDDLLSAPRISASVLPLVSHAKKKRPAVSARNHPAVGQLSGARVRVEDDPGQRWRAQHPAAVRACDVASAAVPALQPVRGRADANAHLYAFCVSSDLRL